MREEPRMAECKLPFPAPSTMEQFMHQFFPPPQPVKKEVEEVSEDPCEGVFASRHEYSPEDNAATSSERDESPDTVSNSPDRGEEPEQSKPLLNVTDQLQQFLRLQHEALQSKMVSNGSISPSSDSSKRGSKIDNLAERLGGVVATSNSSSLSSSSLSSSLPSSLSSSLPSAVSSLLGQSAFQPHSGAFSALAMQIAASQLQQQGAGLSLQQGTPPSHHSVIQPNPSSLPAHLLPTQESMQQLHQSTPSSVGTTPQGYTQSPKRKRQRRNPVWPYFIVEDGVAKCKQCAYSTKSVFSTNLKVHLRSHHRPDYDKVIEAEDQLNLNALLLSGNAAAGLAGKDNRKRSLPPMTSSILMTISKLTAAGQMSALQSALASQQAQMGGGSPQSENEALNALRQSLVANQMNALKMAQKHDVTSAFSPLGMTRPQSAASLHQATPPISHSTPPTPSPAPTPDMLLQQFGGLAGLQQGGLLGAAGLEMPQPKRRRLRRHPVWMFFKDLEDRMVGCINCNFRTGSAFSTNLKMHLKAHHKEDYSKVLKLEDEMRIEEGIFGAPNKIKSELIDFIRGGGNANTPNAPCMSIANPTPSPLVQQLIASGFNGRSSPQTPGSPSLRIPTITINNNSATKGEGEEGFSSLPMADKLAALVGLHPLSGMENENGSETEKAEKRDDLIARLFNNANQTQSLSMSALKAFNGSSGITSDSKSCTSSSVDGSSIVYDDRKCERDRAVAKFASSVGENLVSSDPFKEEEEDRENRAPDGLKKEEGRIEKDEEEEEEEEGEMEMDLGQESLLSLLGLLMDHPSPSTSFHLPEENGEKGDDEEKRRKIEEVKMRIEEIKKIEDAGEKTRRMACERMKLKRLTENEEERKKRLEKMRMRYMKRIGEDKEVKEEKEEDIEEKKKREEERRLKRNEKQKEYQKKKRTEMKMKKSQEELLRVLIPEYDVPDHSTLISLLSSSEDCHSEGGATSSDPAHSERAEPTESPSGDELSGEDHTSQFEQLLQSLTSQDC